MDFIAPIMGGMAGLLQYTMKLSCSNPALQAPFSNSHFALV